MTAVSLTPGLLLVFSFIARGRLPQSTACLPFLCRVYLSGANVSLHRSLDLCVVAPILGFDDLTLIWTERPAAHLGVRPFRSRIHSSSSKCPARLIIILSRSCSPIKYKDIKLAHRLSRPLLH
ncbi:hypothetical protein IW262DRAFT_970812 [Armillaria fumosa]|nr:hypothetical protein IW262DRAFT_970812 [Armillaria fumosa]